MYVGLTGNLKIGHDLMIW